MKTDCNAGLFGPLDKRLRERAGIYDNAVTKALFTEAADALEAQARKIERLRVALMDQIRATAHYGGHRPDVIAIMERSGKLIENHGCPAAIKVLATPSTPEETSE